MARHLIAVLFALMLSGLACDSTPTERQDSSTARDTTAPPLDGRSSADLPGDGGTAGDLRSDDGPSPSREVGIDDSQPPPSLWRPQPGTTWQWQLSGNLDTTVDAQMYDIDLFDHPANTIAALQAAGRVVICYFSAGSYEEWRPDAAEIPAAARGSKMSGWDELWIDIRSTAVRQVMKARLDLALQKGCDGVEPDNVDGYTNSTGFPLTAADQLDYNQFLATEAHLRGLSVGLKNDLDQVSQLVSHFDWALNEQCLEYDECALLSPFIAAGKAVFHVEYTPAQKNTVCAQTSPLQFDTLIKHLNLNAWFEACW